MKNRIVHYLILALLLSTTIFSSAQTFDWAQSIATTGNSNLRFIETDADGNSFVVGTMSGSVTIGSTNLSVMNNGLLLAKLDSSGNYEWAEAIEGSVYPYDLELDKFGNIYVTGVIYNLPITFGSVTISTGSNAKYFLAKFDQNGNFKWIDYEDGYINGAVVGTDTWGNVNVAINIQGTFDLDGTTYTSSTGGTRPSILNAQYDSTGGVNWTTQIDVTSTGPYTHLMVSGLDCDTVGGVYIVGEFSKSTLNVGTDTYSSPNDSSDFFIAKYDDQGNYQWSDAAYGTGYQSAHSISVSETGNIHLIGTMSNDITFGTTPLTMNGASLDYFLVKYDPSGNITWAKQGGAAINPSLQGISANKDDEIFVSGSYFYNMTSFGGQTYSASGNQGNIILGKLDASGSVLWGQYAGQTATGASSSAYDIAYDDYGHAYIAGVAGAGAHFGSIILPGANGQDAFTARIADSTYVPPVIPFPADSVWPGDANYDLIANNFDLLSIGVAFGTTGQTRANASILWTAQPAYDWAQSLASGVNYKHIDTNGDGVINDQDTLAISQNYGLTHNKNDGEEEVGPLLYMEFLDDSIMVGDTVDVAVNFGTDTLPANMIYGLAFTLNMDTALVDPTSVKLNYDNSWLGTNGTDMLAMDKNFPVDGRLDLALTRTDQMNMSGFGEIARFSIIIVDDITAKTFFTEVLKFSISNQYVIGIDEISIPVSLGADSTVVMQEDTTNTGGTDAIDPELARNVKIYPNPAQSQLNIELTDLTAKGYILRDYLGRAVIQKQKTFIKESLQVEGLARGVYILLIDTEKGQVMKKVLLD